MSDEPAPKDEPIELIPEKQEERECLRCRMLKPVDDDGFCEACTRAIEQACL